MHCPYCHAWEVRDQPIGVLGTSPGSVPHALLVRQWSDDVVFFVHTLDLSSGELGQLQARGVQVVSGVVARVVVEADRLTGVGLSDGRAAIDRDGGGRARAPHDLSGDRVGITERRMPSRKGEWRVPVALIALCALPLAAGVVRLVTLVIGALEAGSFDFYRESS